MRKLDRIVLINAASFDYVEFPVGSHTQVIGVNGHGKSTLLRSILFFYLGTNEKSPYALHETKSDFVSYYLGNPPSYLIYELNRAEGEPAFHIAVTRPAGRIQFHFVDAPFRKDYYVDGSFTRPIESVLDQLREGRCAHDSVSSYEEFNHRLYGIAQSPYSIFRPAARSSGQVGILPRIISGIFTVSQLDADKLKSALTCGVHQDSLSTELDLVLLKSQLQNFRRVNRAVKTFLRYEDDAVNLVSLAEQFESTKTERHHAIEDLVRMAKRLPDEHEDLTAMQDAIEKERAALVQQFDIADNEFAGAIQKLGEELAVLRSKIEDGEKIETEYRDRKIAEKRKALEKLGDLREQYELAKKEYDSLTAKYGDEQQRKSQIVIQIQQSWSERARSFAEQRASCERDLRQKLTQLETDRANAQTLLVNEEREAKNAFVPRRKVVRIGRDTLNQDIKALADFKEPDELTQQRKKLSESENKQRTEHNRQEQLRSQMTLAKEKAERERERLERDAEAERQQLEANIKTLEANRDRVSAELDKLDSSLAHFFQTHAPQEWSHAAKTLNRETLFRNAEELAAKMASDKNPSSVWGVEFSAEGLPLPSEQYDRGGLSRTLQKIKSDLASEHDKFQAARERYLAASSNLDKHALDIRNNLESQMESSQELRRKLLDGIVRFDNRVLTLESHVNQEKQRLRADIEKRESDLKLEEERVGRDETEVQQRFESRKAKANRDFDLRRKNCEEASNEKLRTLAEVERSAEKTRDEELARVEKAFQETLVKQGVDPDLIRSTQERAIKAEREIRRVSEFQNEVTEYVRLKLQHVDPLPSLRSEQNRLLESLELKKKDRDDLKARHEKTLSGLAERQRILNEMDENLKKDGDAVSRFRKDARFYAELGYFDRDDLVPSPFYRPQAVQSFLEAAANAHESANAIHRGGNGNARKFLNRFDSETLDRKVLGFSPLHEHFDWAVFVNTELKPFVNGRRIHGMKQIQTQEFEQLIRNISARNSDFQTGVRQVSQTAALLESHLKENNFVDVLDSIELKVERVDSNLTRTLLELEKFADVTFSAESDLFGKRADRALVDKAIETFERLLQDIDNHKAQRLLLTDYFEFSIRIYENGHDMGWRKSLDHIGSTGTDYLVKMLIYLSLIEIYRERAIDAKSGSIVHCILDETGVLAPKYVRSVLEYAKSRGIILITAGHSQQTAGFDNWMHVRKCGQRFAAQTVLRKVLKCDCPPRKQQN